MAENKPGTYGYNKEYAKKYMQKLSEVKVRMLHEEKDAIVAAAQRAGESVNQFVLSAVHARMNRQMERNEILMQLSDLEFDKKEYWVITGAAMVLYGLRPKTHDIDLGCTSALADSLQADGYPVKIKENGMRHIRFNQDIELIENYLFDKVQLVEGFQINYFNALLYGIVGAFAGVFGDLCFSIIKPITHHNNFFFSFV